MMKQNGSDARGVAAGVPVKTSLWSRKGQPHTTGFGVLAHKKRNKQTSEFPVHVAGHDSSRAKAGGYDEEAGLRLGQAFMSWTVLADAAAMFGVYWF